MPPTSPTDNLPAYDVVYNLYAFAGDVYLPEAFIVSRDREGHLAHILQKALPETIGSFDLELDPVRAQLFHLIEELQPKALEQRFKPRKGKGLELTALLEDRELRRPMLSFVHRRLDTFLRLVVRDRLPLTREVERKVLVKDFLVKPSAAVLEPELLFERQRTGVRYQLILYRNGQWLPLRTKNVVPVTNHPAWLLVDYQLYRAAHINGNMVKPFRDKDEVLIPQASVKAYFQKFILKVASNVDIEAKGFDVVQHGELTGCRLEPSPNLFGDRWVLSVAMIYPGAVIPWSDPKDRRATLEFDGEEVRINQVRRDRPAEEAFIAKLKQAGLERGDGNYFLPAGEAGRPQAILEWLATNRLTLEKQGFILVDPLWEDQPLYLHPFRISLKASAQNDWFDLYGEVTVGAFSFPFLQLARYIREDNRLFPLPNGTFFLIPEEWMARYRSLAQFGRREAEQFRLNKSQYTLLQELGLAEGSQVEEELDADGFTLPAGLRAQLRPYQLEGLRWLAQLYRQQLGGCLADDMGLGKTLQTIAALLYAKEQRVEQPAAPTAEQKTQLALFEAMPDAGILRPLNALIILPASLVYNWESEIKRFAPGLTVYRQVGPRRHKDPRLLARFDVILTTYQTALKDVDLLAGIEYEYIVLDESQYIKNRESKVFKAINELNGRHKISLSGTPIENSLSDLWSQMQFINPDLLGSFAFFRREFINPIEKGQDEACKERLRRLVSPYLLRRTKEAVARDLPPLSTKVFYSEMSTEQRRLYEREKSAARNFLLEHFDAGNPQYRMLVLRSLTKLRQLANHPRLAFSTYERDSGKFQDVLEHWETIRRSGHKVLFFSFFVTYLELFRAEFEQSGQPYAWLTGDLSAAEREKQIRRFESNSSVQAFFISIKSGGTGLNLTAADYVFLLDPWWNPFTEQQAVARAHRIGQDKHVMAIKFITKDSIEEKILRLQERKSKLAEDIIEEVGKAGFSKGELEYLFE